MNVFEYAEIPVNLFKYISTIYQWIDDPNKVLFTFLDLNCNDSVSEYDLDFMGDQFAWAV